MTTPRGISKVVKRRRRRTAAALSPGACRPEMHRTVVKLRGGPGSPTRLSDETLSHSAAVRHRTVRSTSTRLVRPTWGVLGRNRAKTGSCPAAPSLLHRYRNERFFPRPLPTRTVFLQPSRGLFRRPPRALPDGPARRGGGPLPPAVEGSTTPSPSGAETPLPHDPCPSGTSTMTEFQGKRISARNSRSQARRFQLIPAPETPLRSGQSVLGRP